MSEIKNWKDISGPEIKSWEDLSVEGVPKREAVVTPVIEKEKEPEIDTAAIAAKYVEEAQKSAESYLPNLDQAQKEKLGAKIKNVLKDNKATLLRAGIVGVATGSIKRYLDVNTLGSSVAVGAAIGAGVEGAKEFFKQRSERTKTSKEFFAELPDLIRGSNIDLAAKRAAIHHELQQEKSQPLNKDKARIKELEMQTQAIDRLLDIKISKTDEKFSVKDLQKFLGNAELAKKVFEKEVDENETVKKIYQKLAQHKTDWKRIGKQALKGAAVGAFGSAIGYGITDYLKDQGMLAGEVVQKAPDSTVAANIAQEKALAVSQEIISGAKADISDNTFKVTIEKGDGTVHLARKVIHDYLVNQYSLDSDAAHLKMGQLLNAEENLRKAFGDQLGESISGEKIGQTVEISGDKVKEVVGHALSLDEEKLKRLEEAAKNISASQASEMTEYTSLTEKSNDFFSKALEQANEKATAAATEAVSEVPNNPSAATQLSAEIARASFQEALFDAAEKLNRHQKSVIAISGAMVAALSLPKAYKYIKSTDFGIEQKMEVAKKKVTAVKEKVSKSASAKKIKIINKSTLGAAVMANAFASGTERIGSKAQEVRQSVKDLRIIEKVGKRFSKFNFKVGDLSEYQGMVYGLIERLRNYPNKEEVIKEVEKIKPKDIIDLKKKTAEIINNVPGVPEAKKFIAKAMERKPEPVTDEEMNFDSQLRMVDNEGSGYYFKTLQGADSEPFLRLHDDFKFENGLLLVWVKEPNGEGKETEKLRYLNYKGKFMGESFYEYMLPTRFDNGMLMVKDIIDGKERLRFINRQGDFIARPFEVLIDMDENGVATVMLEENRRKKTYAIDPQGNMTEIKLETNS